MTPSNTASVTVSSGDDSALPRQSQSIMSDLLRPVLPTNGLRAQLLSSIGLLLALALLALVSVLLYWVARQPPPGLLLGGIFLFLAGEVGIVMLFGDYLLRHRFVRPVERMVAGAEAVADGDYSRRIEPEGAAELVSLSESVNRMADRLVQHQELLAENVQSLNETNRQLTETRNELIHSEKLASVGRLAAGIAHEVGNPLGSILGYVEVARRRGAQGAEWLDEVEREAKRLDEVVRGLLDFARPRQAAARRFEMDEVMDEALALVRSQGRLDGIAVDRSVDVGRPTVTGDPNQFKQVVVNLLLNAADAIQGTEGAGTVELRLRSDTYDGPDLGAPPRRASDPDDVDYSHLRRWHKGPGYRAPSFETGQELVRLEVLDDGAGLSPEDLDRVFEPFYTTKEPGRGIGLGLAVCARLVEDMGGSIGADIAEDRTRFWVLLGAAGEGGEEGAAAGGSDEASARDAEDA